MRETELTIPCPVCGTFKLCDCKLPRYTDMNTALPIEPKADQAVIQFTEPDAVYQVKKGTTIHAFVYDWEDNYPAIFVSQSR